MKKIIKNIINISILSLLLTSCNKTNKANLTKITDDYKVELILTKNAYGDETIITQKKEKDEYYAFDKRFSYITTKYNEMVDNMIYINEEAGVNGCTYNEYKLIYTNKYDDKKSITLSFNLYVTYIFDDVSSCYLNYYDTNSTFSYLESLKLCIVDIFASLSDDEKDITYISIES